MAEFCSKKPDSYREKYYEQRKNESSRNYINEERAAKKKKRSTSRENNKLYLKEKTIDYKDKYKQLESNEKYPSKEKHKRHSSSPERNWSHKSSKISEHIHKPKKSKRSYEEKIHVKSKKPDKSSVISSEKHRKYFESESASDSSSSTDSEKIRECLEKIHEEKQKIKEEKKKQRELMKAMETPEEKRVRRLAKKEAKERKRKERMGWDEEYMGYTNADNPFGDANLLETFVWNKKLEKEGINNLSTLELQQRNLQKQEENRRELEKVKKRRLEREQERAAREEELQRLQREKEAAQFKEWEAQEDSFHLKQAKLRSKIRIQNGRAKPIDLLANYISAEDEDLTVEMHEPYTYLNGLTITDLEDLLEDIKVYMELEQGKNVDYWKDITIITEDELNKLRKLDRSNKVDGRDRRDGINPSVASEVSTVFKGKSQIQLIIIQQQIENKIKSGEGDVGYWESLLLQLKAVMARVRLRDRHQENLRRKLYQLKQEQGVESTPLFPIIAKDNDEILVMPPPPLPIKVETESKVSTLSPPHSSQTEKEDESEAVITEESLLELSYEEYDAGGYSPKRLPLTEVELGTLITDPEEDQKRLYFARQQVMGTGCAEPLSSEERAFEREARKGMTDDEAMFSVEAPTDQRYLWSDKYRPRKPRYFNRVHTGFEWNKYNQTHYDMDNPPPKIVQGYKFNIFYPDLIDKTLTPEYTLTPCEDNKDFAILRFHAGPPYEDIAFKIVNREWEYSYKRGFRCQFYNNIFQLWFHFKRYRYRR